jgi:hypothetical protein
MFFFSPYVTMIRYARLSILRKGAFFGYGLALGFFGGDMNSSLI